MSLCWWSVAAMPTHFSIEPSTAIRPDLAANMTFTQVNVFETAVRTAVKANCIPQCGQGIHPDE